MKKVKTILFRAKLKGRGIVNYDGNQKNLKNFYYRHDNLKHLCHKHDNIMYAKKNFYYDENGNPFYKIKISNNSLKYNMFKNEIRCQIPNIIHNENIFYSYIASPEMILRGYLFNKYGELSYNRTSPIEIVDAEQINNSISKIEFFSRSGKKENKNEDENTKDNSLFHKETIGDVVYETYGALDLEQLRFVSIDDMFDRLAFNSDKFNLYKSFLQNSMPNFNSNLGYYLNKSTIVKIPEYGFIFSDDDLQFLTKIFFKKVLNLKIRKNQSFAEIDKLEIKFVYDCTEDTMYDEKGWEELKLNDLKDFNFEPYNFYEKYEENDAKESREEILKNSSKEKERVRNEKIVNKEKKNKK